MEKITAYAMKVKLLMIRKPAGQKFIATGFQTRFAINPLGSIII